MNMFILNNSCVSCLLGSHNLSLKVVFLYLNKTNLNYTINMYVYEPIACEYILIIILAEVPGVVRGHFFSL